MATLNQEQIDAAIKTAFEEDDNVIQPFEAGTHLEGNVSVNRYYSRFTTLLLEGLEIDGYVNLCHSKFSVVTLNGTTIGGMLRLDSFAASVVDLRGCRIGDVLHIIHSWKIGQIQCTSDQAAAIHYAAPAIPLLVEGGLANSSRPDPQ